MQAIAGVMGSPANVNQMFIVPLIAALVLPSES